MAGSRARRRPPSRAAGLASVLAVAVVAASCGSGSEGGRDERRDGPTVTVAQVPGDDPAVAGSALDALGTGSLPGAQVDPDDVISGGPPPDGIPPIDEPRFVPAGSVGFLAGHESVLAVEVDGESRAYPTQVMIWHEIVNDTFGDTPVTVTYCPLCNTGIAFVRRLGDRVLTFGTSGSLYRSSLVMYDRQTESLWTHFDGRAIAGELSGRELERVPASLVSWADWRAAHPDGLVLSRDTGVDRPYGDNPYPGYDDAGGSPTFFEGEVDGRLAAMTRIVGLGLDGSPTAVRNDALLEEGVVELELDGRPVVVWAQAGTASALEDFEVAGGRDVGATGVFGAEVEGRLLEFERVEDGFRDRATASTWNVLGTAVAGPLAGTRLDPVDHVDTFWFVWAAFAPDTRVLP